jgi:hypothetical protein
MARYDGPGTDARPDRLDDGLGENERGDMARLRETVPPVVSALVAVAVRLSPVTGDCP